MAIQSISGFAEEVTDAAEGDIQTFLLFSQDRPQHDLGMIDSRAVEVEMSIGGRDYTIKQSPGVLASNRAAGTTGAALWRTTALLAEWMSDDHNCLFNTGIFTSEATILELGSGIAGLMASVLVGKVGRIVVTDQSYALPLLRENLAANSPFGSARNAKKHKSLQQSRVDVLELDWEADDISHFVRANDLSDVAAIIASDCVYNYHLIKPLVQTCVDICKLQNGVGICLIAQQLRQEDVFEDWLDHFLQYFRVWRVSDDALIPPLQSNKGYAVHIGVLRVVS